MEQQHNQAVRAALESLGLPGLQIVADTEGIAALERLAGSALHLAEALRRGIEAFLSDTEGSPSQGQNSAHHVVQADPESYGLGPGASDAEIAEALRAMLAGNSSARVVLLTPATTAQPEFRFLPQYGESTEEHWVFRIINPSAWPIPQWSIVDLRAAGPVYSYGFD